MLSPETIESVECESLSAILYFLKKTADPAAWLHTSFPLDLPQGEGTAPFSQEIHKLSTETL